MVEACLDAAPGATARARTRSPTSSQPLLERLPRARLTGFGVSALNR